MERLLVPNDGVKGIDVTTERGTVKYDADASGSVHVDNPKHIRQMVAEGFTRATGVFGFNSNGSACVGCGFASVFTKYTCPKCGVENG